ncbi:LPXTG cell wall anchor domain-containing protein [Arthrobacter sp. E3]|uniref:LPXTG cell wall anchor domain-containing protein n=1 Tax=Arthrobacter sp. E3 TaxID=517402 RepID=UPI001A940E83|nr:LPXTG cell wall anchor domain-containing protein [Arthrobacter sp. E3]
MKKILAGVALASLITLSAGSVAAQAAPNDYPAGAPSSTVSTGTVIAGEAVIFSGSGFIAGEIIDITVTQTSPVAGGAIGSMGGGISASVPMIIKPAAPSSFIVTADSNGAFSTPITLEQTGTYTLTAKGRTSGVTVSQVVKVVASVDAGVGNNGSNSGNNVAGDKDGLASTGLDTSVLVWSIIGVGALGAGVGTVVVSRRRNRESANA